MEVLLEPKNYGITLDREGLTDESLELFKKDHCDQMFGRIETVNIGPGSDLYVVLVTIITGATTLVALGDKLNKGLEGWIKIGKKLRSWVKSKELVSVDAEAATALAIEKLNREYVIEEISKTHEWHLPKVDFSSPHTFGDGRQHGDLITTPHGYFTLVFDVNDEVTVVVCVTSDGEVKVLQSFEIVSPYGLTRKRLKGK